MSKFSNFLISTNFNEVLIVKDCIGQRGWSAIAVYFTLVLANVASKVMVTLLSVFNVPRNSTGGSTL